MTSALKRFPSGVMWTMREAGLEQAERHLQGDAQDRGRRQQEQHAAPVGPAHAPLV
jgi:hypothetical protein